VSSVLSFLLASLDVSWLKLCLHLSQNHRLDTLIEHETTADMTRGIITIIFTLLLASVLATPINSRALKKRSFKVPRVAVKNYVPNGPKALKRAYAKFGLNEPSPGPMALRKRDLSFGFGDISIVPSGDVAEHIQSAAADSTADSENGETSATGTQNDSQFLSPVTVGGQELVVNFDSGSSDT